MTDRVLLAPTLAPALSAAGLASAQALLTLGDAPPDAPHVLEVVDIEIPGTVGRFHLKRYHYGTWRRAQGLLGRGTLWGRAPEINEFKALQRLREIGVPAVRPVAAASRTRRGRLVGHALLTEHVPDAVDLARRLRTPGDPVRDDRAVRRRTLTTIANHLARMHAEGFVHGDCHARNVLVRLDDDAEPYIVFLDCRRGGAPSWRRPPLLDLATLDGDVAGLVPATDRLRALRTWLPEGRPSRRTHEAVARRREKHLRRDARRGRPRR
jgi:hypothetical protein